MIEVFDAKHNRNIETIDEICEAINKYLAVMKNAWDYRMQSNRSPAIIKWQNCFIDYKKHLNDCCVSIFENYNLFLLIKIEYGNSHSSCVSELEKLLPLIHNPSMGGIGNSINLTKYSQDNLIDSIMNKSLVIRDELNRLVPQLNKSFHEYIFWIGELEKEKTSNYEEMGLIESILFKEHNELGRDLATWILQQKFESLTHTEFQQFFNTNN
jgi:hypothetical protein